MAREKRPPLKFGRAWCLAPVILLISVFGMAGLVRPAAGFLPLSFDARFQVADSCAAPEAVSAPLRASTAPGATAATPTNVIVLKRSGASLEAFGQDMSGRILWAAAAFVTFALGLVTIAVCAVIVARHFTDRAYLAAVGFLLAIAAFGLAALGLAQLDAKLPGVMFGFAGVASLCGIAYGYAADRREVVRRATLILVAATIVWTVNELPLPAWMSAPAESSATDTPPDTQSKTTPSGATVNLQVTDAPSRSTLDERKYRTLALTAPIFDRALIRLHVPKFGWVLFDRVVGGVALLVVVFLAFAVCALTAQCWSDDGPDEAALRDRAEAIRLLEYLGAAVLVSSVIFVKTLHDWPLALVCDKSAAESLTLISNHWSVVVSTYWTLLLIAVFVPAQIALGRSARALARTKLREDKSKPVSEKAVSGWLEEQGLLASPAKQVTQLAALLSPWLTSVPIAAVIEILKKGFGD